MLKSYVCFDLETTGLDPLYNEIIEIGALKVRRKGCRTFYGIHSSTGRDFPDDHESHRHYE